MDSLMRQFADAQMVLNGPSLAQTLTPIAPLDEPGRLRSFALTPHHAIQTELQDRILYDQRLPISTAEANAWVEVYTAFWNATGYLIVAEETSGPGRKTQVPWSKIYEAWKELAITLIRGYTSGSTGFPAWTVPCLYVAGKYLRIFAIKADDLSVLKDGTVTFSSGYQDDVVEDSANKNLSDAASVLTRIFQLCISDRAPISESRKWGLYYITNLLFKTYFRLNNIGLSKNIIRALGSQSTDMPPLESYPKSHIVTYKYYTGVICFLEEDYVQAQKHLTEAWDSCLKSSRRNQELILTYLIPCKLLTDQRFPASSLLAPFPRLQSLFAPLNFCIKRGDLSGFSAALAAGEDEFIKRRIYLTLERCRDVALRNLLRKVFLAGGFEELKPGETTPSRRTRIPIKEFGVAIGLGQGGKDKVESMENDEVECLLANMIYKNFMRGYISHERGMVVLSKGGAFPGTGV